MVMLKQRGVDCVCRFTSHRRADFRRGRRLGPADHIVQWLKPNKPRTIDSHSYSALPEFLLVRELRLRVEEPGFRTTVLVIATTLLDADEFTKEDLAQLYRARWNVSETDDANGNPAVQNTGTSAQGNLDALAGLQSHPNHHGPSSH
jgi:hypothetical protein